MSHAMWRSSVYLGVYKPHCSHSISIYILEKFHRQSFSCHYITSNYGFVWWLYYIGYKVSCWKRPHITLIKKWSILCMVGLVEMLQLCNIFTQKNFLMEEFPLFHTLYNKTLYQRLCKWSFQNSPLGFRQI